MLGIDFSGVAAASEKGGILLDVGAAANAAETRGGDLTRGDLTRNTSVVYCETCDVLYRNTSVVYCKIL